MIFDCKTRILHINEEEKIKLTKPEEKLLICLATNNAIRYSEIKKYTGTSNLR